MSASQGAFGVLLGLLNCLFPCSLIASSVCIALKSLLDGGSYVSITLNIVFFYHFFHLLLVPSNSKLIANPKPSSFLGRHGDEGDKLLAFFFWLCGLCLQLLGMFRDDTILQSVGTMSSTACLVTILPVTRREAIGAERPALRDTSVGTSDTDAPADHSSKGGDEQVLSTGFGRMLSYYAIIWVFVTSVGLLWSQGATYTSADGILGMPMMVNDTFIVDDTFIVNDTFLVNDTCIVNHTLLNPELITHSIPVPIPVPVPDFIPTTGTPCKVTLTPAPPSPVAKSAWGPAAMPSTPMPTPEATPTALPGVGPEPETEPEPEPEPEPQPETVATPQDSFGAFQLMVELFTSEAKSALSSEIGSVPSWFLNLRIEDQFVACALLLVLVWHLFSPLSVLAVGSEIIPRVFFIGFLCNTLFLLWFLGVIYDILFISSAATFLFLVAIISTAAVLAHLLNMVKVLRSHAAQLPIVMADVLKLAGDVSSLTVDVPALKNSVTEYGTKLDDFMTATAESTSGIHQKFRNLYGLFQGAWALLYLMIMGLYKRLTALESRGRAFATRMTSVDGLIRQLQAFFCLLQFGLAVLYLMIGNLSDRLNALESRVGDSIQKMALLEDWLRHIEASKADLSDIKILQWEMGEARTSFDELQNAQAEDRAHIQKKLQAQLEKLSAKFIEVFGSLQQLQDRVEKFEQETRDNFKRFNERLTDGENARQSTQEQVQATKDDVDQVKGDLVHLDENAKEHRAETNRQHEDAMKAVKEQGTSFDERSQKSAKVIGDLINEKIKALEAGVESKLQKHLQSTDANVGIIRNEVTAEKARQDKRAKHITDVNKAQFETLLTTLDGHMGNAREMLHGNLREFLRQPLFLEFVCTAVQTCLPACLQSLRDESDPEKDGAEVDDAPQPGSSPDAHGDGSSPATPDPAPVEPSSQRSSKKKKKSKSSSSKGKKVSSRY
ncbi:hypothetical protein DHEL01_v206914 [Diaporthe helianthi]|uniref:Uncharacterized protein n=1 Tax=Diaporthe helianthi TaxID=158607 RepID=A0A2P5HWS0_DIAHE|nr:hypothetical protein DHEL01_v206914 [Diaporthe helianthi]